ncbi:MAG TPA: threonine dehydratase [Marinilabiliales bacterium]|jgi:threonine dehydratase|nr:MAG: threonine dehydratase [Bacteroidetes bacterium GWA2_40_14]OFX65857.1 MAG: threonine dehydratase [Bacteroidetes bacterium GWC2_40_13]OFX73353.1 MAG: threonine dehydratase [Bacteroidetes bacterium GWD2_40_43]OFX93486.1 MAG: threonine dehydratase [Bacteroidetes bacterium GWE2_40_63]OFZ25067.1 MAG: threonine dehydratase [Bacteroidetes bacterium RIFOXYC2_FULL_40_12]HAM97607.1 threonine dehydratase [Marinilabiliales bacterium]
MTTTKTLATTWFPSLEDITKARVNLGSILEPTPLMKSLSLSAQYGATIYLKREDLQQVRSYKIRGAYHKISSLPREVLDRGIVCASAGNHAQGVAYSAFKLKTKARIFMPETTPKQKVRQVTMFGKEAIEIILIGDSYDQAFQAAKETAEREKLAFIHPFDDMKIIEGQATVGIEILQQADCHFDYVFIPIGGGGLASGISTCFKTLSPNTKLIGLEPEGAPSMKRSIEKGEVVKLDEIDTFVDGAAVQQVGQLTFQICKELLTDICLVPEGLICTTILKRYNEDALVVEPAGAMSMAALELFKEEIKGKNICCIVSGSNNDITRTEEIKERSLIYEGLKHYFIVRFPQRAGALREFVNDILSPGDDITLFEYSKKHNREKGPALIGIELQQKENFQKLIHNFETKGFGYEYLNDKPNLFQYLV